MKTFHSNLFIRVLIPLSVFAIVFACSSSYEQKDDENESESETSTAVDVEVETETNNPYMVFKLYKVRSKGLFNEPRGLEIESEFDKIYAENDVKVIGSWLNANDPNELYFMTAYHSIEHYQEFVESMKTNDKYQELSLELAEDRESIESVDLRALQDH